MIKHKFGAIRSESEGIKFPSKLERNYFDKLKLMVKSGSLTMFLRQPKFDIGGGCTYSADFIEFYPDGTCRIVDCKGVLTKEFVMKKKIVESLYPIEIEIVKKV